MLRRSFLVLALAFGMLSAVGLNVAQAAAPYTVYGVTATNQLIRFSSATPGTIDQTVAITGLAGGDDVLGIDFRPATGQLYALGSGSRLYTINTTTGAATQVGSDGAFTLTGTDFGFDVNPFVDRIRVVSDADQNIRLNPNDGALTATDTNLNPGTPNEVGVAYTNDFAGATSTTLYGIDSGTGMLVIQNPPNSGTLTDVGALGVTTTGLVGFDITTDVTDKAFASLSLVAAASSGFYSIDLSTGAATLVGTIGIGATGLVRDIALQLNQPPVAADDSYSTPAYTTLSVPAPGVLTNDADPEGSTLTAIKQSDPSHGSVTFNSDGSFTYVPTAGFTGTDSFTYSASDGTLGSNLATVTISVGAAGPAGAGSPVVVTPTFTG
jgi:hypothetical protein